MSNCVSNENAREIETFLSAMLCHRILTSLVIVAPSMRGVLIML